jgi:membrane associated rhomboid family serine protease
MPRSGFSNSMMMTFPPFGGMVRKLIYANLAVYFGLLLLGWVAPGVAGDILRLGALTPAMVTRGALWQILTYSFLHVGIWSILFNMLSLWFVGAYMEAAYGTRWITELYFISVIGAALATIAVSYTGIFHLTPMATTFGPMGGIFGLLAAFAVRMGDQQFLLFPLPISIRAKYLVLIYILIAVASLMQGPSGFAYLAYLGGALFGYLYAKQAPRRGFAFAASERIYGTRNAYYRWKRKRAARKFEVYMRQHKRDTNPGAAGRYTDPNKDRDPNDRRWMH